MAEPSPRSRISLASLGRVGLVGAGNLGSTLARALVARGAVVVALATRHPERAALLAQDIPGCQVYEEPAAVAAASDLVLLAVPDDAIPQLDAAIPWRPEQAIVHFSGARGVGALAHATACGAAAVALHPLMIFPRPAPEATSALARFAGCTWALEASDTTAAARLEVLVAALDGHVVRLTESQRVPYHLAAVMASNHIVTLLGTATEIWKGLGVEPRAALDALLPLVRATVENLDALGPAQALSGPVARGDLTTVAAHLSWLHEQQRSAAGQRDELTGGAFDAGDLLAAYRGLARLAIPLARARGSLSDEAARALERLLDAD